MGSKMYGPFRMVAEVFITDGDGTVGKLTYEFGAGKLIGRKTMAKALESSLKAAKKQNRKLRLMDKGEFWNQLIYEKTGSTTRFAVPGRDEFDALVPTEPAP